MKHKKLKGLFIWAMLLLLILGQTSAVFAGKPTPPPTTSAIDITTQNLTYNLLENETVNFTIKATLKKPLTVEWTTTPVDGQLALDHVTPYSKVLKKSTTYYEDAFFTFTPVDISELKSYTYTITATDADNASNTDSVKVTFNVSPIAEPVDAFVYVALGDSIPSGVSYEGSIFGGTIESYSDKMSTYFQSRNATYEYHDLAVSGYNAVDVLNQLNDSSVQAVIQSADVITLCVGANDIMDAAKRTFWGSIDFYDINWGLAETGRYNFEQQWPQIIQKINALNPQVELLVTTIYNPYNKDDAHAYNLGAGQDSSLKIHDQVDLFMWSVDPSKPGLNDVITMMPMAGITLTYKVVDVHKYFEDNYLNNKGAVTAFYDNVVQDPHPDSNGQTVIYTLHVNAYEMR